MIGPHRQGGPHLVLIERPIVGPGDASAEATGMVQHSLDNMRGRPEIAEAGGGGSPQIMCGPVRQCSRRSSRRLPLSKPT